MHEHRAASHEDGVPSIPFLGSLRNQLLFAVGTMLLLASFAAAAIAVVNGRKAVAIETTSSAEIAERYIRGLLRRVPTEVPLMGLHAVLSRETFHLRHAQLHIRDYSGALIPVTRMRLNEPEPASRSSPKWFQRLMTPQAEGAAGRLVLVPGTQMAVIISGEPIDEIDEKWNELSDLAMIWLTVVAILLSGLFVIMGRILDPLVDLAHGLIALEAGSREQRVTVSRTRELAEIATTFNSLAASLDQVREENGTLYRQIMAVQEEERRHIAGELHDEAGPCLFAITVSAESIDRLTAKLAAADADKIRSRSREILEVAERLKTMNRALLKSLSPMSIGKVSLPSLLDDLVKEFERRHSGINIVKSIELLSPSYGEKIDLTLYRCIQEGLTNAIRHGRANSISILLNEGPPTKTVSIANGDGGGVSVNLSIRDNGVGLDPSAEMGFGLAAMRERVLSVNGTWVVGSNWPAGVAISISIPAASIDRAKTSIRHSQVQAAQ